MTATFDPQLVQRLTEQSDQPDPMLELEPQTKPCAACGATLTRNPHRSYQSFANRRFCNSTCHQAFRRQSDGTRTCERCGDSFSRRVGQETRSKFAVRQFCGRSCASKHIRASQPTRPVETKTCRQCGVDYARRAKTEDRQHWEVRKYCSHACSHAARKKEREEKAPRKPERPRSQRPKRKAKVPPPPMPIPPAPPREPGPVWRPAGWAPVEDSLAQRGVAS